MADIQDDPIVGSKVLSHYRVLRLLAKGGMGAIYLARKEGAAGITVPVIIKRTLKQTDDENDPTIKMFVREAKILASLRHPNIVSLLDFAREQGEYVMAMEYVHGFNLDRWLKHMLATGRSFPVEMALHVAILVLDALHYAHTLCDDGGAPLGIVHRDVTPSNVLIDTEGHVKLADFGIARSSKDKTTQYTGAISLKGKMPYIAPELYAQAEPTPASDVYSVGVLLHELLLGRNEFSGSSPLSTMFKVMNVAPVLVHQVRADVSEAVGTVLARALAKSLEERFLDAQSFATALRRVRTLDSDTAQRQFSALVRQDFSSAEIAKNTGQDLQELQRVLRADVPSATRTTQKLPAQRQSLVTVPTVVPSTQRARDERTGTIALWSVVGIALGLGAGVAALRMARRSAPALSIHVQAPDNAIRQAVQPSVALMQQCVGQSLETLTGQTNITLRLQLDAQAHPRGIDVLPLSVAGTSAGDCLRAVARGWNFSRTHAGQSVSLQLQVAPQ